MNEIEIDMTIARVLFAAVVALAAGIVVETAKAQSATASSYGAAVLATESQR